MARRKPTRLDAVLRIRKIQEDMAAAERQRAELEVAAEEARFAQRELDLRHPWTDRAVVELAFEAVDRAAQSLAGATSVAEERRAEHLRAVQRARAIAKLVERRREEIAKEELRKEAAVLDDLASIRHNREHSA